MDADTLRRSLLALPAVLGLPAAHAAGRVERLPALASRHVETRPVDVWLPPGYDGRTPHAVLYMHDGQMLFDPASTWNRQAWEVDRIATPLLAAGALRPFIVVGVWNAGPRRAAEYFPEPALAFLEPALRARYVEGALAGWPGGSAYLRFLVDDVKPAIDRRYATRPEREHTLVMGSSYGGLASLHALLEAPQVFGGAAALSTHWIGTFERNAEIPAALLAWMKQKLGPPGRQRLYLDRGTAGLDAKYDDAQAQVDALLRERGLLGPDVVSRVFEGADHTERDWQARLEQPLRFLLSGGGPR